MNKPIVLARLGFLQKSMESHIFTPLSNCFSLQITEVRNFVPYNYIVINYNHHNTFNSNSIFIP